MKKITLKKLTIKQIFLWGIPVLFLIGALAHMLYEFTGSQFVVGLFFPVNESIFEHIKLSSLPIFLWYLCWYYSKKSEINADLWFTSGLISLVITSLFIPMLYYFYTGMFGVQIMAVDVIILLVALFFGQVLAYHFYRHGKGFDYLVAIVIMLLILFIFALFTVFPPKIPLFLDESAGTYGIFKVI